MDVKYELLQNCVEELVEKLIIDTKYDFAEKINERAISALEEIKSIVSDYSLSDIEVVEGIVYVFEKYSIGCGGKHDF